MISISQLRAHPKVLDAGMATGLENLGYDLSGELWSAKILLEDPAAISAVHQSHVDAGAEIITTASYQISAQGFEKVGRDPQSVSTAISKSIELAREVAERAEHEVWVAASIGPYGAVLADGSEYRGDYVISREALLDFHAERLTAFAQAAPDIFAFETIPSVVEISVINELAKEFNIPIWISASAKNADQISDGTDIAKAISQVDAKQVIAVGVNCTKPEHITSLLLNMESELPKIVYPNAGRTWDAVSRTWLDEGIAAIPHAEISNWQKAGAVIIGGCCGLGTQQISNTREVLQKSHF